MEFILAHPILIPFVFIGMWLLVLSLLSILGGWGAVAENYPELGAEYSRIKYMQSLAMERLKFFPVNFSAVAVLSTNDQGVRISLLPPFRPFHPPIFLPFADMDGVEKRVFFFTGAEIRLSRNSDVKILISESQAKWFEQASRGNWAVRRKEPREITT
ncbi:hypothetical protein [Hyphococcus sp.]|uniref:hypothetical protein n=1 Tax=Hyphococcus sp. TaxID=2038636 RepID=UPI002087E677|nr:MAG: hypothetical protein DHS20C04_16970 [Marinicaulis sp.]